MNLKKYLLLLLFTISIIGVKAQFYGGTAGTGSSIKLLLVANSCPNNYDTSVLFYRGGNYGSYATNFINVSSCIYTIDSTISFYRGGNYGSYGTTLINASSCSLTIDSTLIFYRGGNYGSYGNTLISASQCNYTVDSSVIFYRGGNYGSYSNVAISNTACPAPPPNNIFIGGTSSNNSAGNLVNNASNNTAGPFIATISDTTIMSGGCVVLTTTGTGATTYSWSPTAGLNNPTSANPTANPTSNTTYTVTATGSTPGCRNVATVNVIVNTANGTASGTSISYPTSLISTSITSPQSVIVTGITGGAFSTTSANLKLNVVNGEITPNTSTAGTYTVNYTYGTCASTVSTSVVITTNTSNHGEINYPNFYLGATSGTTTPKKLIAQSSCSVPIDYTLLLYAGGTAGTATFPKSYLSQAACVYTVDNTQSFYVGGTSGSATPKNILTQSTCVPYINPSNTIYMGGTSGTTNPRIVLTNSYCSVPVGSNFYVGGSGVGYGNASLTPSTTNSNGTPVTTIADLTVCPGVSTTLSTTGATNYTWTPATGLNNATIANPIATPVTTTTYTVVGTGSGVGCVNSAKVTITVLNDSYTSISYGAYRFNENDMSVKKVNYIVGPLTGTYSAVPSTGLLLDATTGSFTPGLSTSGLYTINYNYTKAGCNYTYPVNINITTLPPTITYPNPSNFYLNYSGVTITPTVTDATAIGFVLLNSLPAGLTMNTTTGVISGTPSALVNNAKVGVQAYNYTKLMTNNYSDTYTMTINVLKPIINSTTTNIYAFNTSYGIASSANTVNVSGQYIYQNIVVTPSLGFEVSKDNTTYANTVSLSQSGGTITSTNIYVRLGSNAPVGSYTGTVTLTSTAADSIVIPIALSSVVAAPLTVTASYFQKFYGSKLTLGTGNTNFTASGLMNNETIGSITLTAAGGTGADDNPGMYAITPTNATGGTFSPTNYTINYVPAQFEVLYSLYGFNMTGNASNWVQGKVPIPKIPAGVISNITNISANYDALIPASYYKLSQKGVCWSTNINPTINNSTSVDNSAGTGPMTVYLNGLIGGSTYYARTFIKVGNYVYYGPNVKFTLPY